MGQNDKDFLKQKYNNIADRIRNSYLYFIGFGYEITRECGTLFYIVPNEFLFQIYMGKAREYFLDKSKFIQAVNLGLNVFNAIVPSCIIGINKTKPQSTYGIKVADSRENSDLQINTNSFTSIDRKLVHIYPNATFSFNLSNIKLVNKLLSLGDSLGSLCENISNGISTGCDEVYIVNNEAIKINNLEQKHLFPCLRGNQVQKFLIPTKSSDKILYITKNTDLSEDSSTYKYLRQHKDLLIEKSVEKREGKRDWKILFRPREAELFLSPKLVFRQTGDRPICAVDKYNMYCIDSLNVAQFKPQFQDLMHYCEAICNSKLMAFFYQEISQEKGRVLAQIKPQRLKAFPIRIDKRQVNIIDNLVQIIKSTDDLNEVDGTINKIDLIIYKLYELTFDEVRIIDSEFPLSNSEYQKFGI